MSLNLQEIIINFSIEECHLSTLNFNNLYLNKVIPAHWQLLIEPIQNDQEIIICFKNRIHIIIQSNQITLSELVSNKAFQNIEIRKLALNLIEKLSQIKIIGISINPDYYYYLDCKNNINQNIYKNILGSEFYPKSNPEKFVSTGIQKAYNYKGGELILDAYQVNVEVSEKVSTAICFEASFDYRVFSTNQESSRENSFFIKII